MRSFMSHLCKDICVYFLKQHLLYLNVASQFHNNCSYIDKDTRTQDIRGSPKRLNSSGDWTVDKLWWRQWRIAERLSHWVICAVELKVFLVSFPLRVNVFLQWTQLSGYATDAKFRDVKTCGVVQNGTEFWTNQSQCLKSFLTCFLSCGKESY